MEAKDRIIVALDTASYVHAERLIDELNPHVDRFKVGLQLFTTYGVPDICALVPAAMLDLKLHDIPSTMAMAVRAALGHSPWGITVHASAGVAALKGVVAARQRVHIIAVTLLTSHDEKNCQHIYGGTPKAVTHRFFRDADEAGCTAIVCSAQELASARANLDNPEKVMIITPGIRPEWAQKNDQARVMTPREAVEAGADYLVIGRPITQPPDGMTPAEAAQRIADEIE